MVRTLTVTAMMIIEICLSLRPESEVVVVVEEEGSESTLGVKVWVFVVGLVSASGRGREEGRNVFNTIGNNGAFAYAGSSRS